jgi:hypothetical protein
LIHDPEVTSKILPGKQVLQFVALIEQVKHGNWQAKQEVPLKNVPLKHFEQFWKLF